MKLQKIFDLLKLFLQLLFFVCLLTTLTLNLIDAKKRHLPSSRSLDGDRQHCSLALAIPTESAWKFMDFPTNGESFFTQSKLFSWSVKSFHKICKNYQNPRNFMIRISGIFFLAKESAIDSSSFFFHRLSSYMIFTNQLLQMSILSQPYFLHFNQFLSPP